MLEDKKVGIVDDIAKEVESEMKEKENDRGILDILAQKAISRKLLVWITATILLCTSKITAEEWTAITMGYVGVEGFTDLAIKWRGAGK